LSRPVFHRAAYITDLPPGAEADEELESILDKLKGDWKSRTSVRIEACGA
jgi:hypothetical protein